MASSPYARRGVLFEVFSRYFGRDGAPVLVWRGTSLEMNSSLDPRIVSEAFEADAESAAAEYNAEFRTDISAFIDRAAVQAVVPEGVMELPPALGIQYTAFVDPSGGSTDSMTLAVAHMESNSVAVLDCIRERKPPFSPEDVTMEFAALLRSYNVTRVSGDAYAGEWPRERFATHGVAYELSDRNKSSIYQDFLPALNGRRIRLLDHPRLIAQLTNLERRVARGGRDSIDHGPGGHDDLANAAAGALTLTINEKRPALIHTKDMVGITGAPSPTPTFVDVIFATLFIGQDGLVGTCYFAWQSWHAETGFVPLVLMDFDALPWSGRTIAGVIARLEELGRGTRVRLGSEIRFSEELKPQFDLLVAPEGLGFHPIGSERIADRSALLLAAGAHVATGKVKLGAAAQAKDRVTPLSGLLAMRAQERIEDNALRLSFFAGLEIGLNSPH